MLRILRQRNFGLLWAAGLISLIGDWVLVVGLPIEVYTRTGSTLATMGWCWPRSSRRSPSGRSPGSSSIVGIGAGS
jgi:hypothetical protein